MRFNLEVKLKVSDELKSQKTSGGAVGGGCPSLVTRLIEKAESGRKTPKQYSLSPKD